jgi:hypothetical protein
MSSSEENLFDDGRDTDIESLSNASKHNGTNVRQGVNVTGQLSNKSSTNRKAGTMKRSGAATEGTESTRKRVVTERSKKYAELATTNSKGVRLNKDAQPTRAKRNGKAMQNQVVLHHASKPRRKVHHRVLKLSPGNGGMVRYPIEDSVTEAHADSKARPVRKKSSQTSAISAVAESEDTQVVMNDFVLSKSQILALSGVKEFSGADAANVEVFRPEQSDTETSSAGMVGGYFRKGNDDILLIKKDKASVTVDSMETNEMWKDNWIDEPMENQIQKQDDAVRPASEPMMENQIEKQDDAARPASEPMMENQIQKQDDAVRPASEPMMENQIQKQDDAARPASAMHSSSRSFLQGYVDIINMTEHTFLGFNYILRIVDPVRRFGFAVVLRSNDAHELIQGFDRLISMMRVHPACIYYDDNTSFVTYCISQHKSIDFFKHPHSSPMKKERSMYKRQLRKWLEAYNNNWVRGAVIVQAIVNSMPLIEAGSTVASSL